MHRQIICQELSRFLLEFTVYFMYFVCSAVWANSSRGEAHLQFTSGAHRGYIVLGEGIRLRSGSKTCTWHRGSGLGRPIVYSIVCGSFWLSAERISQVSHWTPRCSILQILGYYRLRSQCQEIFTHFVGNSKHTWRASPGNYNLSQYCRVQSFPLFFPFLCFFDFGSVLSALNHI